MIVVIQCAASKRSDAEHLVSPDGMPVVFVAQPQSAPINSACVYARPARRRGAEPWQVRRLPGCSSGTEQEESLPAVSTAEKSSYVAPEIWGKGRLFAVFPQQTGPDSSTRAICARVLIIFR